MKASHWIDTLGLSPHPEGGFYKETYRAELSLSAASLGEGFGGERNASTAIYYLLEHGDFSAFHRIASDEVWHHYDGGELEIHMISPNGQYTMHSLGKPLSGDATPQYVVPAGWWFASRPAQETPYALVGCTVSPGFDFADFEMAKRDQLCQVYPEHQSIINALTRE